MKITVPSSEQGFSLNVVVAAIGTFLYLLVAFIVIVAPAILGFLTPRERKTATGGSWLEQAKHVYCAR